MMCVMIRAGTRDGWAQHFLSEMVAQNTQWAEHWISPGQTRYKRSGTKGSNLTSLALPWIQVRETIRKSSWQGALGFTSNPQRRISAISDRASDEP